MKVQFRVGARYTGTENIRWRTVRDEAGKIRSIILSLESHIKKFGHIKSVIEAADGAEALKLSDFNFIKITLAAMWECRREGETGVRFRRPGPEQYPCRLI